MAGLQGSVQEAETFIPEIGLQIYAHVIGLWARAYTLGDFPLLNL